VTDLDALSVWVAVAGPAEVDFAEVRLKVDPSRLLEVMGSVHRKSRTTWRTNFRLSSMPSAAVDRRVHARSWAVAMLTDHRGKPDDQVIRRALCRWGFNTAKRTGPDIPAEVVNASRWVQQHCRPVSALNDPAVLRHLLNSLGRRLDGRPAAPSVASRKRKILGAGVGYAVEKEAVTRNPIPALQWTPPKTSHVIDRRRAPNPTQSRRGACSTRSGTSGAAATSRGILRMPLFRRLGPSATIVEANIKPTTINRPCRKRAELMRDCINSRPR
jgi:hypothetical protein